MGPPRGNQNARKHGYYSKAVKRESRAALDEAAFVKGLDEEIALARFLLRDLLTKEPDNREMQLQTLAILGRLSRIRSQAGGDKNAQLKEALTAVMTEAATNLGLKFIPWPRGEPMPGDTP